MKKDKREKRQWRELGKKSEREEIHTHTSPEYLFSHLDF